MEEFKETYGPDYWDEELPIQGSGDSFYPSVGFVFGSFKKGDDTRPAQLPKGWKYLKLSEGRFAILDERGVLRVEGYKKTGVFRMYPLHRFFLGHEEFDLAVEFLVWDRDVIYKDKPKKIFSKKYSLPNRSHQPDIYKNKAQQYAEFEDNKKWLDNRFPKWHDYKAYWGESCENTEDNKNE